MPYPMTHLCIAYNILKCTPQIKNPSDFLLGSIAPDSVHFRDNYDSNMKKVSHLMVGDKKWGEYTNNEEWLRNILAFLEENKGMERIDFLYGYCGHLIADIQNNIKIWMPFRLATHYETDCWDIYHNEAYSTDGELYLVNPHKAEIWEMLRNAVAPDFPDVVVKDEIYKITDNILNRQYNGIESKDLSGNKFVTLWRMQEFVIDEANYIKDTLHLNK